MPMAASGTLTPFLPPAAAVDADSLLSSMLSFFEAVGLDPYPAQEEAILELFAGHSVVLNTPTGSGKSLVATAMCFKALAEGKRAFYTAPIKALVAEKFFAMCRELGADDVGMMTGDASVNRDASVICCTAEILANLALREGAEADVDYVVMDEFHFYSDRDRGVAWQVPLLTLPRARFLLMSATLGDTERFTTEIAERTGAPCVLVRSDERPVPLDYEYRQTPLHETLADLVSDEKTPVYVVHFTHRAAAAHAQDLMSTDFLSKEEKRAIKDELSGFRWNTPFGKELSRWVRHGVGVHHAGMLPKYRLLVEKLAQKGMLRIICGTDTLGVGVNVPIRSVLFTQLCKFDGEQTRVLTVRDFKQIAGRAGRRGFDTQGTVVAQAPAHHVENEQMRRKAAGDAKKLRKLRLKKPPERGYAHWDEQTFERLRSDDPEALVSRFRVDHGMLMNVLSRDGGAGCAAMKALVRASHESPRGRRAEARRAIAMFRALVGAGVVRVDEDAPGGYRIDRELQRDFSLNQALSLFAIEAISALDREAPAYALDVTSVVEAILENPRVVLYRQVDTLKSRALARMKAEGLDYDERIAELEKIDYERPLAEFLYETLDVFRAHHPWLEGENVRPKSVARDLYERGMSFREYVQEHGLGRAEGVLLRHLSNTYKALVQNVPEAAKTAELYDLTESLGATIRQVDSSLLDEWDALRDPEAVERAVAGAEAPEPDDVTRDERGFTAMVRNECFRLVTALARRQWERAAQLVRPAADAPEWSAERIEAAMADYYAEHQELRTDPVARGPRHTQIAKEEGRWRVTQVLLDPEQYAEHYLDLIVDLAEAREAARPVLTLRAIAR